MSLNVKFIQSVNKIGRHSDGRNGLYLQVNKLGLKSWIFRYSFNGRRLEMGLGHIDRYSLVEARIKAQELSNKAKDDKSFNPIAEREQERQKQLLALNAKIITFQICMDEFITFKKAEWSNVKHAQQWTNTLTTYAIPFIGELDIKDIETSHIKKLLHPIWTTKTETATRVRNRIEQIINYAIALDYRKGDNPARWRGHLDKMLPKPSKIAKVKHHKALPYKDINRFITQLREKQFMSAYALEFLILTGARTGAIIQAQWSEIDFIEKLWIVPPEAGRKIKKAHEVPLNKRAIELLTFLQGKQKNEFIFAGQSKNGGLSNGAMDKLLQKTLDYPDITVHGFRSTFRDWIGEEANTPNHVAEMALSHTIKNDAEAAYRRGNLLEKRRVLMGQWLEYINTDIKSGQVIPFKKIAIEETS